ncbi:hypothetical protein [Phenylobacterium sp.]|nr:hypothetical protein [Phenylobacterium sp.]MDP3868956.1 hypothetical protein [Phenylobacterium sp.]
MYAGHDKLGVTHGAGGEVGGTLAVIVVSICGKRVSGLASKET